MSPSIREKTKYPGVYRRVGVRVGEVFDIKFRDSNGRATIRTVHGSLDDAARAKDELVKSLRPSRNGAVFAAPEYHEPLDVDWIIQSHSTDTCVYVGQRKINPVIVKIGFSTFRGVRKRMDGERLHLLLAMPGDRSVERSIHERFDAYQCDVDGREFFFLTKEIRAWIDEQRELVRTLEVVAERSAPSTLATNTHDLQEEGEWAHLGLNRCRP